MKTNKHTMTYYDPRPMIHDISWRTVSTLTCFRLTASDNSASRYCTSLRWAENSCHLVDDAPPTLWRGVGKGKKSNCTLLAFCQIPPKGEVFDFVHKPWLLPVAEHARLLVLIGRAATPRPTPKPCFFWFSLPTTRKQQMGKNGDASGYISWSLSHPFGKLWNVHRWPWCPLTIITQPPNVCIRATTCTSWSSHFWALADDPAPGTAWQIVEVLHGWFEVTRGSFPEVTKHCSSF